ncbi:MAG: phosphate starvation-inducible protein PhoH [Alphaproteobacteria bacterium]|nr:phosphate starvation-inducible protein PhoH [Alphaproteobacteria bacterium]
MPKPHTDKSKAHKPSRETQTVNVFFDKNHILPLLYGEMDSHLGRLEQLLNVSLVSRGNMLSITGHKRDIEATEEVLQSLYRQAENGIDITLSHIDAAVRLLPPITDKKAKPRDEESEAGSADVYIKTLRKTIVPYSHVQANYMRGLYENDLLFALGPAGTGKTYIAVAMAVYQFINKKVERIILSRPAVEAGEKLGFLPGDIKDKLDPFMRPLYDALFDMMPAERVQQAIENGEIELAPLAFMRGRTFSNAFVILDEAQNTTRTQMKMFLTRMGEHSRMIITGDLSQIDLPKDVKSGLADCIPKIENIPGIGVVRFSETDVVRHPIAAKIIKAYDEWEDRKKQHMEAQGDFPEL